MAKERRPAVDYLIYLAVRCVVGVIQAMPVELARGMSRLLAALVFRIDRRHRQVAKENLRHAFPNRYTETQLDQTVQQVYDHFVGLIVEIAMLPRKLHVHNWRKYMNLVGGDRIVGALTSGRPLLIVTGHYGNWELAGFALGLLGFKTYAIARVLDNPHLETFLKSFRQKTGQTILAKKGDFDHVQDLLGAGAAIATLADQDAGPRGLFVDFFGRPASTFKSIALLSMEYNVPLLVIGTPKVAKPMQYHVVAEDLIDPAEYADRPDAAKAITQRYTSAIERLVRGHPEQYFWLHRRWKNQPPVRKSKPAVAA
jgi:Kdo2-lipid IVA lauroyltransferase/acyltransferase